MQHRRPPGRVASTPSKTRKRVPLHHLTATNAAVLMIAITAMSCCLCGVAALIARYVLQRTTLSAANHFPGEAAERVVSEAFKARGIAHLPTIHAYGGGGLVKVPRARPGRRARARG